MISRAESCHLPTLAQQGTSRNRKRLGYEAGGANCPSGFKGQLYFDRLREAGEGKAQACPRGVGEQTVGGRLPVGISVVTALHCRQSCSQILFHSMSGRTHCMGVGRCRVGQLPTVVSKKRGRLHKAVPSAGQYADRLPSGSRKRSLRIQPG